MLQSTAISQKVRDRLAFVNTLLCNVGLEVQARTSFLTGEIVWVINTYDDEGVFCGPHHHYKHERSMMRAAWRLYREQTGE